MNDFQSLSHTKWDCKFQVGWIPKCRKKVLYGPLRKYLGMLEHPGIQRRKARTSVARVPIFQ